MTDIDGRATRWAGQRAKRRVQIVEAAIEAIGKDGPEVSTELIAVRAGIARPQLYRHFDGSADLHRAVAMRAAELVLAEMNPVLTEAQGSPMRIIDRVVRTLVGWLADHANLYRYITRSIDSERGQTVLADVRTTIGEQLRELLAGYLTLFGAEQRIADPLAFGFVGFVESTTDRWLTEPGQLSREELIGYLSSWIWGTIDNVFRSAGVTLEPNAPLDAPDQRSGETPG